MNLHNVCKASCTAMHQHCSSANRGQTACNMTESERQLRCTRHSCCWLQKQMLLVAKAAVIGLPKQQLLVAKKLVHTEARHSGCAVSLPLQALWPCLSAGVCMLQHSGPAKLLLVGLLSCHNVQSVRGRTYEPHQRAMHAPGTTW